MKYFRLILLLVLLAPFKLQAQQTEGLPKGLAPEEIPLIPAYRASRAEATNGITTPPPFSVRTMAEWEEIEYLCVTWTQYTSTVREIIRYAVDEVDVIVFCTDSNVVKNNLANNGIPTTRVHFQQKPFNSIWIRDYGANTVYKDEVDSLQLIDWIYNRPRPLDDAIPEAVADFLGVPLYANVAAPYDLVHTGGNLHNDGFGTAFSSKLVIDENGLGGQFNVTPKNEVMIDSIMKLYMGIERYIKMEVLPYDQIHHIDMHMRLLDEETILVGEYPPGTADGPQIEANLQYVLSNFNSVWGTPYRVKRIQMPPQNNGWYPPSGDYRTYTNSVILNKTMLVPVYEPRYDTTALRILRENLPGYRVIGIDCNQIIQASGALHCITRAVGAAEPLLIAHQRLRDTPDAVNPYQVDAWIKHVSGIASATLWWTTDTTQSYQALPMTLTNPADDTWTGYIPAQSLGTEVFYYIGAAAVSGKTQVRPMPAPAGYWNFMVQTPVGLMPGTANTWGMDPVFPNPAKAVTCIPVHSTTETHGRIRLLDLHGKEILEIHSGNIPVGESKYFFFANELPAGMYMVEIQGEFGRQVQKVTVQ